MIQKHFGAASFNKDDWLERVLQRQKRNTTFQREILTALHWCCNQEIRLPLYIWSNSLSLWMHGSNCGHYNIGTISRHVSDRRLLLINSAIINTVKISMVSLFDIIRISDANSSMLAFSLQRCAKNNVMSMNDRLMNTISKKSWDGA